MMTETTADEVHLANMKLALDEARKSPYKPTSFCVGACIYTPDFSNLLSTGYTRELPTADQGEHHAEHSAMAKLQQRLGDSEAAQAMRGSVMYTTMEPCSVRKSGGYPCANRIIEAGMGAVYLGVAEPADFVVCESTQKLSDAGIKVVRVQGLEDQCLAVARGEDKST